LINSRLPSQTGFTAVFENFGATVQNKGWEFTITSKNIQSKNFSWTTSFFMSGNRNKLIAFPGLETSPYASIYVIGMPTSELYGFKFKDVNPTTGIFEFYAADGKTAVQYPNFGLASRNAGDQIPIANLEPDFQGGFGNTLRYKNFNLLLYFQFSDQKKAPNYLYGIYAGVLPGTEENFPTSLLGQFWEKPGDNKPLERLATNHNIYTPGYGGNYFAQSTGAYSKDFYVRLKTVSITYNLPAKWAKQAHMSNGKIFINAQNLLTFTSYKFLDPETPGSYYGLPLQRVVSGGISLDF
jgi:hypothetical protein